MKTRWLHGDECEVTGKSEIRYDVAWDILRRLSDDKIILALPEAAQHARTIQRQKEWQDQQDQFRRLHKP